MGARQARVDGLFQRSTRSAARLAQDAANGRDGHRSAWQGDFRVWRLESRHQGCVGAQERSGHALRQLCVQWKDRSRQTVKELGLDDKEPFLSIEERATLEQLLTSRSGIYLPSGNKDLDLDMPKRGSEYPGTHFVYNNWDFNAAGTAFEKLTGKNIYDAVESDIARPIAMQDYDRSRQKKIPTISVHSEYHFDLSTRDMARLGLLMQRGGNWNGKQIIPGDWVRYTTTLVTPFNDINPTSLHIAGRPERWGYGAMWWVWDAPVFPGRIYDGPLQGAYTAMGTGGQYITVLPKEDIVIAHKVNIDKDARANISPEGYDAILAMVIDSKCAGSCP